MIHIERKEVERIPYLVVEKVHVRNVPLPTVIYYHGFHGGKEDSLTIAYKLAQKDIRVILPDCHMHGERKGNVTQIEIELSFWDIVMQNVKELEVIKKTLQWNNLIADGKVGVGGTSMGGITTCAALTQYQWINVAGVVMGTPNLLDYATLLITEFNKANKEQICERQKEEVITKLKEYDLSLQPELLHDRPLQFWHGEDDQVVPTKLALDFYETNKVHNGKNFKFVKEAGRAHHVSRLAVFETVAWFDEHLMKEE